MLIPFRFWKALLLSFAFTTLFFSIGCVISICFREYKKRRSFFTKIHVYPLTEMEMVEEEDVERDLTIDLEKGEGLRRRSFL